MSRFYLENCTAESAQLSQSTYAAHMMRAEVNDRNHSDKPADAGFACIHVCIMDAMIPFAGCALNEDRLSALAKTIYENYCVKVEMSDIYDAIGFLNAKRYLRKHRLCYGRNGFELSYLSRGDS